MVICKITANEKRLYEIRKFEEPKIQESKNSQTKHMLFRYKIINYEKQFEDYFDENLNFDLTQHFAKIMLGAVFIDVNIC